MTNQVEANTAELEKGSATDFLDSALIQVHFERFKAFKERARVNLAPITVIAGVNSGGKTTILQSLLLVRQSLITPYRSPIEDALMYNGELVRFSHFNELIFGKPKNDVEGFRLGYTFRINKNHLGLRQARHYFAHLVNLDGIKEPIIEIELQFDYDNTQRIVRITQISLAASSCHEGAEHEGPSWALSDDLRDQLLAYESPWTLIGKVGWVRDLMITFPGPLSNTLFSTVEFQPDLTIQPNILADYVQPETQEAWKEVIWACLQQENAERVRLASFPSQEQASIKVLVDNELKAIVELICQIADWEGVRIQIDPWFKHGLPPTGDVPYEPPKQWHTNQPFPTGATVRGPGFVDKRARTWVWDNQEKHWDVQDSRQGHGRYIRVTSDGRLLD